MAEPGPLPAPILRERRERTITALCEHFAQDRLSLEELERRIDVAQRTHDPAELEGLLLDLGQAPAAPGTAAAPAPYRATAPALPGERPGNGVIVAIMGAVERRGAWQPAARTFVLGLMGGAELDFREVALPPGETEVFVLALMGGVEIIVPPGMAVDSGGIAIMGGITHVAAPRHPDAPVLRVHGLALMGGVDIRVRLPGESAKEAARRLKAERRDRRQLPGS